MMHFLTGCLVAVLSLLGEPAPEAATPQPETGAEWLARVEHDLGKDPTPEAVYPWLAKVSAPKAHFDPKWDHGARSRDLTWRAPVSQDWIIQFRWPDHLHRNTCEVRAMGVGAYKDQIPQDLYEAVRAIAQAPDTGEDADSVLWIRAVNLLHNLGKDQALEALEWYVKTEREQLGRPYFQTNRVFWITQVLFEQIEGGGMPRPRLGQENVDAPADPSSMPLFPVVMQDDIPFLLVSGYTLNGVPEMQQSRIDFCRASCRLREKPLAPSASPRAAAKLVAAAVPGGFEQKYAQARVIGQGERASQLADQQAAAARGAAEGAVAQNARWSDQVRDFVLVDPADH